MAREGATRRQVLKTGSALAATGVVSSMAGCSALPFFGGFSYGNWMHEPGEVSDEAEHYGFYYVQPKTILNKEDNLDDAFVDSLEQEGTLASVTDVSPEDFKHNLSYSAFQVGKANYNKSDVTSELEDNGFDDDTDHEGYTIYLNEDQETDYYGMAVGVTGGTLVSSRGDPENVVDRLETAIDTKKGNGSRYVEEVDEMKTLVNKAGTHHLVSGRTFEELDDDQESPENGRYAGQVGMVTTLQVKGQNSKIRRLFVFTDNGDASDADVDDWVDAREDGDGLWSEAEGDINTNVNGKAAVAKATVPSDEIGAN